MLSRIERQVIALRLLSRFARLVVLLLLTFIVTFIVVVILLDGPSLLSLRRSSGASTNSLNLFRHIAIVLDRRYLSNGVLYTFLVYIHSTRHFYPKFVQLQGLDAYTYAFARNPLLDIPSMRTIDRVQECSPPITICGIDTREEVGDRSLDRLDLRYREVQTNAMDKAYVGGVNPGDLITIDQTSSGER